MKITRKELRKLIQEAIVVDPYGSARVISDDPEKIDKHDFADETMEDLDPLALLEPEMARKVYDAYDSKDIKDKRQAIEYAAQLGAIPDDKAHEAHLDIQVAKDPAFSQLRYDSVDYHKLLQSFMDRLDKIGAFVQKSGKKPPTVYGVGYLFQLKYGRNNPNFKFPDHEDFEKVGADIYSAGHGTSGAGFYITGYDSGVDKRYEAWLKQFEAGK